MAEQEGKMHTYEVVIRWGDSREKGQSEKHIGDGIRLLPNGHLEVYQIERTASGCVIEHPIALYNSAEWLRVVRLDG